VITRLIAIWILAPGALLVVRTLWRERRRLPAAPDNKPPVDIDDLIVCRRILRETETRKESPKP